MRGLQDTIAAQATAAGEGGIAIVRISGDRTEKVLEQVFRPRSDKVLESRVLTYGMVVDDTGEIDEAMAVFLRGPATYTRQDMGEIQCHGSQLIVRKILQALIEAGVRIADPGEFTYRAFVNGRIDLTQAEAVMRLIQSNNEKARTSAVRQINGGISSFVHHVQDEITELSAAIAANIDFPDEVEEVSTRKTVIEGCKRIRDEIQRCCSIKNGKIEEDGVYVSLYGRPNAGKSSLLNALLEEEKAIVTDIPGTTRDIVTGTVMIEGVRFTLTDTAGLRDTEDTVERIGVERARKAINESDIKVYVIDGSNDLSEEDKILIRETGPDIIVLTKDDLPSQISREDVAIIVNDIPIIMISAKENEGIIQLKRKFFSLIESDISESSVLSQTRHIECAQTAAKCLGNAEEALHEGLPLDMVNIDLMEALKHLGEITGDTASEMVIDHVFSHFCVGK